jgi:carboxynorspermidine decarboxylase
MEIRDIKLISEQAPDSCFVIHKQLLIRNLEVLKQVSERSGAKLLLALKGYACHATFPIIRPYIDGIAASSPHEAQLGREKMGGELHAYAPAYSIKDIEILAPWVDHIVFNSRDQLIRFAERVKRVSKSVGIGIRLNPEHSEADTERYDPSARHSRLGLKQYEWNDDIPNFADGIHVHNLCENDSYALERTLAALKEKFGSVLPKFKWINMGGGHLITRKGYNIDHLVSLILRWKEQYNHEVYLEPGEAFGWGTGVLKAMVLDIKPAQGTDIANVILNVSATAHMPDTLEMPYRADIYGAGKLGEKPHGYRFGGISCLAGDTIGEYSLDEPLKVGDPIILMDMAHYTMVKTTFFNGVQMPGIAIYDGNSQITEVVREFGYLDYADKLS